MNQSLHWSLLACTALALLLMTPVSARPGSAPVTTFATVVGAAREAIGALGVAADANRGDAPEAATVSLLVAGVGAAWCVRRRNSIPSR